MIGFLGEIACKLDSKGRLSFPAKLLKQLSAMSEHADRLVINRGFDSCLILYTLETWKKETEKMRQLNRFNRKQRRFYRLFIGGANDVKLDANHRLLVPKLLMSYAGLEKEVILSGQEDRIELWDKSIYEEEMSISVEDFSDLAHEVMTTLEDEMSGQRPHSY